MKKLFTDLDGCLHPLDKDATEADFRTEEFYLSLPVNEGYEKFLRKIKERGDVECYSATHYMSPAAKRGKKQSADSLGIFDARHQLYIPYGESKAEYVMKKFGLKRLNENYILLDDHTPNCEDWKAHGGRAFKVMNGMNGNGRTWKGERIDLNGKKCLSFEMTDDPEVLDNFLVAIYRQAIKDLKIANRRKEKMRKAEADGDISVKADITWRKEETKRFLKLDPYGIGTKKIIEALTATGLM